jgi:hypothetical protein
VISQYVFSKSTWKMKVPESFSLGLLLSCSCPASFKSDSVRLVNCLASPGLVHPSAQANVDSTPPAFITWLLAHSLSSSPFPCVCSSHFLHFQYNRSRCVSRTNKINISNRCNAQRMSLFIRYITGERKDMK